MGATFPVDQTDEGWGFLGVSHPTLLGGLRHAGSNNVVKVPALLVSKL